MKRYFILLYSKARVFSWLILSMDYKSWEHLEYLVKNVLAQLGLFPHSLFSTLNHIYKRLIILISFRAILAIISLEFFLFPNPLFSFLESDLCMCIHACVCVREIAWHFPQITDTVDFFFFFPPVFFSLLCLSGFNYIHQTHCWYVVCNIFLSPSSRFFTQIIVFFTLGLILQLIVIL